MRKFYSFGVAAFLVATPAMAQVVIGGDNDARHERSVERDRMQAHRDHRDAQREAEMGNYGEAARDQRDAHRDWREAHRDEYRSDRDDNGVRLQLGH